jgi:16S rRNA (uracil1498-N3)-methyltransferase
VSPPLFWVEDVPRAGTDVVVSGSEGRHAVTVTRLAVGAELIAGDGRGSTARCEIVAITGKDSLVARAHSYAYVDPPRPRVTVVQALPKSERSELAVDLATEAGADEIVPWQAARCVARWTGKADKGRDKWRAAAVAAAKQSRRPWIPSIAPLASTTDVRSRCADAIAGGGVAAILHEDGGVGLRDLPIAEASEIVLVVGPEGGVDDTEIADLTALGATPVILGPEILRTSSAAAVALGAIGVLTDRWVTR